MATTSTDGFGSLFSGFSRAASNGAQTAWAIDPVLGNDQNIGTPAAPLATMAEFCERYLGVRVRVAATLQLVGDVIDSPLWLSSTRFASAGTLTISGTTATIGTATITLVTGLNTASATVQPWQLTTTGINWTTVPLGSRLLLSNGSVGFIRNVIDANNVVCGAFCTKASASIVPTTAFTITVQSLSRALPPNVTLQALDNVNTLVVQDLSFDTSNLVVCTPFQNNVLYFGCELKAASGTTLTSVGGMQIRGSRITMPLTASTTVGFRSATGQLNLNSCVFAGATSGFVTPNTLGSTQFQHACIQGARILVQNNAILTLSTSCNISHTTTAVQVDVGGYLNAGIVSVTGTAGTGIGVDVRCGSYIWNGASAKPTITGASDCAVAGVSYTYAALGTGKTASLLNAIPPTVTPVVNTDANRGPGIATMSQSG